MHVPGIDGVVAHRRVRDFNLCNCETEESLYDGENQQIPIAAVVIPAIQSAAASALYLRNLRVHDRFEGTDLFVSK